MSLENTDDTEWTDEIDGNGRVCKICYGGDKDFEGKDVEWNSPCKCSGSIKWVHRKCLELWIQSAPILQQSQCNTCKFPYKRCYSLKPIEKWSRPSLRLTVWDTIEILLDMYSTFKLVRGTIAVAEGRKSIIGQFCYFVFWRLFIFNSRRIEYYKSIVRSLMASFFETSIVDASD